MNKIKKIFSIIFIFLVFVPSPILAEEKSNFDQLIDTVSDNPDVKEANPILRDDMSQQFSSEVGGAMDSIVKTIIDSINTKHAFISPDKLSKLLVGVGKVLGNTAEFIGMYATHVDYLSSSAGRAYEGDYSGAAITAFNGSTRAAALIASATIGATVGTALGPVGTVAGAIGGIIAAGVAGLVWDETYGSAANILDQKITDSATAEKYLADYTKILLDRLEEQIAKDKEEDALADMERTEEIKRILRRAKDPYTRAMTFYTKKYNLMAARQYAIKAFEILEDNKNMYPELLKISAYQQTKVLLDDINKAISNATAVEITSASDEIEVLQGKDVTLTVKVQGGILPYQYVGTNGDWINENEVKTYWKASKEVGETIINLKVRDNIEQVASKKITINVIAEKVDQEFKGNLSGTWSGKGTGDFKGWTSNGTFIMNISESGKISGSYTGDDKGKLSGYISGSGKLNIKSGGGSAGSGKWGGTIKTNSYGKLQGGGTWSVDSFTGTWHGSEK